MSLFESVRRPFIFMNAVGLHGDVQTLLHEGGHAFHAQRDQAQAVADYRRALALGGTVPLPQLYTAAGTKFAFDAATLRAAVNLMEETINSLDSR
jgi:oligoendopeptidase F